MSDFIKSKPVQDNKLRQLKHPMPESVYYHLQTQKISGIAKCSPLYIAQYSTQFIDSNLASSDNIVSDSFQVSKSGLSELTISNFYLSEEELRILSAKANLKKRTEFICSRYLIKKMADIPLEDFKQYTVKYSEEHQCVGIFTLMNNGKSDTQSGDNKEVDNNEEIIQRLSLSHSGAYVAFMFYSKEQPVGLDIEVIKPRDFLKIAEEFFSQDDIQLLSQSLQLQQDFFSLWTTKEAVAKLTNTSVFDMLSVSGQTIEQRYNTQKLMTKAYSCSIACSQ
ncbi:MAG: 4'-phosphopantetheinyl transferase family protein [Colwellia sp.]